MSAVLRTLQALARSDEKQRAIITVEKAAALVAPRRPPWWRWTVYLAAAITIERIVKA
jgi:hypothetical protein